MIKAFINTFRWSKKV